ncbi:2461_t:CDS:2 [Entrophospora sp. SA101]|nr:2461_t:CDS:2 [Entrophospora sp. SA101]
MHYVDPYSTNCTILISNDPLEEAITNVKLINSEIETTNNNNSFEETESNNNVHIPMNKEIEDTINYGEVKNTTCNTRFWLKVLTDVRTKMGYNYDISEIVVINQLQEELIQFFQALHKHLDGKIKKIQDLSINKQKKSDSFKYDEIYQILTHPELNKDTPLSTTYKTYFWLCFLCGFCGVDAQRLKLANVELAAINGLTITIPCEKNNAGYSLLKISIKNCNNVQINLQITPKD